MESLALIDIILVCLTSYVCSLFGTANMLGEYEYGMKDLENEWFKVGVIFPLVAIIGSFLGWMVVYYVAYIFFFACILYPVWLFNSVMLLLFFVGYKSLK